MSTTPTRQACVVNAGFTRGSGRKTEWRNLQDIVVELPESELGSKAFRDELRKHAPSGFVLSSYALIRSIDVPDKKDQSWQLFGDTLYAADGTRIAEAINHRYAKLIESALDMSAEIASLNERLAKPVDLILYCPSCGLQHIDKPGMSGVFDEHTWTNPPHRSHLCHGCGTIWRPADVPTNGVAEIKTCGKADTWPVNADEIRAQAAGSEARTTMKTCGKPFAPGQRWAFCGETDMGQTAPVQCVECDPKYGFMLRGATPEQADAQAKKVAEALDRYKAAGYSGRLQDY